MSSNDITDTGKSVELHPTVKNAIIVAVGVPPLMVLWAAGIAALGMAVNYTMSGATPSLDSVPPILNSDVAWLAIAAAIGYLYLVWANVVFGNDAVESSIDQAEQIQQRVEEIQDDETGT